MQIKWSKSTALKAGLSLAGIWILLGIIIELSGLLESDHENRPVHQTPAGQTQLDFETIQGGFFSMLKPLGWAHFTAGQCGEFAIVLRDPTIPTRQIFFFGMVGPLYMSDQQRQIDQQAVGAGGYPVAWMDSPVIDPLSPENVFAHWREIVAMQSSQAFMPQSPRLEGFQIISSTPVQTLPYAQSALVRGLFTRDNMIGEGLFLAAVRTFMPFTGAYGSGTGVANLVCGITASQHEFVSLQPALLRSLESLEISQSYAANCAAQRQEQTSALLRSGRTLSDTSDMIMNTWQNRNKSDDVIAAKRRDGILGKERVYNPDNGEVYEFDAGWYDRYTLSREQHEMSQLQLMSGDSHGWDIWNKPMLDGPAHVH